METALAALEGSGVAVYFRSARWGYAAANAIHILGIALLVGAILPLNLRLLGVWRSADRATLVRVLAPVAAVGLAIAAAAGLLLFSVRPGGYAELTIFRVKLGLILVGTAAALWAHWRHGRLLDRAGPGQAAAHAVVSLLCWLAALACGRLIAFVA